MKGLMKNLNPHFHKAIPTAEDCRRIKAQEAYYRPRLNKILGEAFLELFKMYFKGDKMQEVMKDGSKGKTFVEDTIEALFPHIKKSLEDPKVRYVKVYSGNKFLVGLKSGKQEEVQTFLAEEDKVDVCKDLIESLKEEEEKLEIDEKGNVVKKEK